MRGLTADIFWCKAHKRMLQSQIALVTLIFPSYITYILPVIPLPWGEAKSSIAIECYSSNKKGY